jgi:disulfide bond formation protein DsbB
MTRSNLILIAMTGSAALLAGAFAFEHFGGLAPCILCWYQRYPHFLAVLIGLVALRVKGASLPLLGALAALTSAGIGVFHVGVEAGWWEGLAQCSVNTLAGVSAEDLLNTDVSVGAPAACDKVAWSFIGISIAGWNVIASTILGAFWTMAAREKA